MLTSPEDLLTAWEALLPGQNQIGQELLTRYSEPHRRYHTVDHLAQVLDQLAELAEPVHDLFLVRLAAWFHDAVYAIPAGQLSNEDASARLAFRRLGSAGLEQEDLNEVARLIRLTASHRPGARDPNGELLCDADLSILAADEERYQAYADAVRAEYAAVPEQSFAAGRLAILEPMLETELYRTTKGRRLNAAAQANLERECAVLRSVLA